MNANAIAGAIVLFVVFLIISGVVMVIPQCNVYYKSMNGKAILKEAEYSRQALVEQARAERDASKLQAEAIGIVGKAAKEYPEYREMMLMQSYGNAVEDGAVKMIFVPTEANVPIITNVPK